MGGNHQAGAGLIAAIEKIKQRLLPLGAASHLIQIIETDNIRRLQTLQNLVRRIVTHLL